MLRKRLSVLVVMAAIGGGLLLVGAAGSKVQASQPEHSRGDSSNYFAHQQGHKGKGHNDGLDPALQNKLEAAFEKSFRDSGAPGAIAAVRTPEGTWVSTRGVADLSSGEPMRADMYHRIGSVTRVCAYDRPGTTRLDGTLSPSTPVRQPTTAQDGAADLHALLSAAKQKGPYVLVAHS